MLTDLLSICSYIFLFLYSLAFSGKCIKLIIERKEPHRIALNIVRTMLILGLASILYVTHVWDVYKLIAIYGVTLISIYVWTHTDVRV